jgi:hypothetical protein
MKSILIINTGTPEARHAAKLAIAMAKKMEANILLANTMKVRETVRVLKNGSYEVGPDNPVMEDLLAINNASSGFKPQISELDISAVNETQLAELVHKNDVQLVIKGASEAPSVGAHLNIQTILNKIHCPLLLVPANWQLKDIERMVYIADLRYCRTYIVRYLAELAKPWKATVSVAHLSVSGLADMEENYANSVFEKEIQRNVKYPELVFNNIREKDLSKAVDVIINGMHNDVLVLLNHRYHYEEILGRYLSDPLPANITVPVLAFPY